MTEEEGVQAIIALQKLVGIEETEAQARKSWRSFEDWEKEKTILVYEQLKHAFSKDDVGE